MFKLDTEKDFLKSIFKSRRHDKQLEVNKTKIKQDDNEKQSDIN